MNNAQTDYKASHFAQNSRGQADDDAIPEDEGLFEKTIEQAEASSYP